jgi:prevent-host-death family protein
LIDEAAAGEEILIARSGKPVARLVPLSSRVTPARRRLGALAGVAVAPPNFGAPLP